ncbi:MAG: response regulator [Rhodocyclaceae bacterium]|nr:response regulator [Rhodocyclaceae bacterium]
MRILLLEDQPVLSEAIASHLTSKGFSVDVAGSIRQADAALSVGQFDAAFFDLSLPDGDGVALLTRLRQQDNKLPVIIMTARDRISDRIRGLEAGADDYVVKPFDLNEMVARLQAVLRRYSGNPNPVLRIGRFEIDQTGYRLLIDGKEIQLTAKEWAVLAKLVAKVGALVSKEQLEEALYNFNDEVGSNTLEVYVSRLRKKLGKETIETVRGMGYRWVAGEM